MFLFQRILSHLNGPGGYVVDNKLDSTREASYTLFHRIMFFDGEADLRARTFGRMLQLVEDERGGAIIDTSLMKTAVEMLGALCTERTRKKVLFIACFQQPASARRST